MKWSVEVPKEPGFYWTRWRGHGLAKMAEVTQAWDTISGALRAQIVGQHNTFIVAGPGVEWAGPVPEPENDAVQI